MNRLFSKDVESMQFSAYMHSRISFIYITMHLWQILSLDELAPL